MNDIDKGISWITEQIAKRIFCNSYDSINTDAYYIVDDTDKLHVIYYKGFIGVYNKEKDECTSHYVGTFEYFGDVEKVWRKLFLENFSK